MDLLTSVWCGCAGDIVVDFDSLILVAGTHTHTGLTALFPEIPGEPVPER